MLFSLLKHYLDLYIADTALNVSRSLYGFTTSVYHGVENYFPRLWGTGISDAILYAMYMESWLMELDFVISLLFKTLKYNLSSTIVSFSSSAYSRVKPLG